MAKLADGLDALAEPSGQDVSPAKPPSEQQQPSEIADEAKEPSSSSDSPDGTPEPTETPKETESEPKTTELSEDLAAVVKPAKSGKQPGQAPKELREAYERANARIKELETAQANAVAESTKQLEAVKSKLAEAQQELQRVRYEESEEFTEKFIKPLTKAQANAAEAVKGIKLDLGNGETRDAGVQDVLALARMDPGTAWDTAHDWFGKRAPLVIQSMERIRDGIRAMEEARTEWRQKGSEFQKQRQAQMQAVQQQLREAEDARMTELQEALPDVFSVPADDPEAAKLVTASRAFVDVALGRAQFRDGISPEEQAKAVARSRGELAARARALPLALLRLQRKEKQIADLEAKLAAFQKSEPKTAPPRSASAPQSSQTGVEGLDALAITVP